jgi:hypothetical protein
MLSIKSNSAKLLILLVGCLISDMVAQADETTTLRDSQPVTTTSDSIVTSSDQLAASNTSATKVPVLTKDATEEGLIRKTEPLPQFYFPY